MPMMPEFEELYKPYSKDATLDESYNWLKKQCAGMGIDEQTADASWSETFLEMAQGKKFSIGTCDCGCDFPKEWSCVAFNHHTLKRAIAMNEKANRAKLQVLNNTLRNNILFHIEDQNRVYVEDNLELTKWQRFKKWLKPMGK